ncbi:RDD family protein [Candidatus Nomurabacteria bacterium]|nr:RDD family protein [Candidatus Nomurabacteria bacterium]
MWWAFCFLDYLVEYKYMICKKCKNEVLENTKFCSMCGSENEHQISKSFLPASKNKRLGNYFIDKIGVFAFALILNLTGVISVFESLNEIVVGLVIIVSYYLFFEGIWGSTPGKLITKTKLVTENGTKPEFSVVLTRSLYRLIPLEALSFLIDTPIGWHDKFSNTVVVSESFTKTDVEKIDFVFLKNRPFPKISKIIFWILLGIGIIAIISSITIFVMNKNNSDLNGTFISDAPERLTAEQFNARYGNNYTLVSKYYTDRINQIRRKAGLPPVSSSTLLTQNLSRE